METDKSEAVLAVVRGALSGFRDSQKNLSFEALNLDSFDLVTLRVAIEQQASQAVPDRVWLGFKTIDDIVSYYASPHAEPSRPSAAAGLPIVHSFHLNMPQMAVGGLSEYWLFREFGDIHWTAICKGLHTESHAICDESGNRLYATFVRFRWEGTRNLSSYGENEKVEIRSELSRFGRSMFFSNTVLEGQGKAIRANLMSAFASRAGGNRSLVKGEPTIPAGSPVRVLDSMPAFSEEYRKVRKGIQSSVSFAGEEFDVAPAPMAEIEYQINPYQDINGVNLLYFAAYPAISDVCEREFIHRNRDRIGILTDWALEASTIARDVMYFGNCEVDDRLVYRIHSLRADDSRRVSIAASISRRSDGQLLSNIFTVKARN